MKYRYSRDRALFSGWGVRTLVEKSWGAISGSREICVWW